MINTMRNMSDKFKELWMQIYSLIYNHHFDECDQENVCEEYLESCEDLTNKIVLMLTNDYSKESLFEKLVKGEATYEYFRIKIEPEQAIDMADKMMALQADIKKYAKLAMEEREKFPDDEVDRIERINAELEEYLRIGEEIEKEKSMKK